MHTRCPICQREVEMLTEGEAARVLGIGEQVLEAFINAGRIHLIETVSGKVWVCKDSLFVGLQSS